MRNPLVIVVCCLELRMEWHKPYAEIYERRRVCNLFGSFSFSLSLHVSHSLVLSIRKFFAERIILFMCENVENVLIENYFL
jgi:hypothetical protein